MTRVVLVPGVLALLPEYAGFADPVADLRAACLADTGQLGRLGGLLGGDCDVQVTYAAAPYGVQYWVMTWTTA